MPLFAYFYFLFYINLNMHTHSTQLSKIPSDTPGDISPSVLGLANNHRCGRGVTKEVYDLVRLVPIPYQIGK